MTIKEIARRAGVSVATVSYVLNGTGSVSEEVRQHVLQIVKETNYRKNILASKLRTNSSNILGVIVEDITVWTSARTIQGIGDFAEQHNKNILMTDLALNSKIGKNFHRIREYRDTINKEIDILLGSQVEGILYVSMHDRDLSHILPSFSHPFVLVGCYAEDFHCVTYDNTNIAYSIGKHFIENGHTRFGVISGPSGSRISCKRLSGFTRALAEQGFSLPPAYICSGDWEYVSARQAAFELLALPDPPTAIFAMNDLMAAGVLSAAHQLNLKIPENLEIVGFDDQQLSQYSVPPLTTVQVPLYDMGKEAAAQIYVLRESKPQRQSQFILPCRLLHRGTTRS